VTAGLCCWPRLRWPPSRRPKLISSFRLKHGEVPVVRDATLDRNAQGAARAMAAKDNLSHEVLGPFTKRIAPARAGPPPRTLLRLREFREDARPVGRLLRAPQELLLHNASRAGLRAPRIKQASAPYWAMVIAGDYEPKPARARRQGASCCCKT